LNILEGYDLAKLGDRSAESIHFTTEAFRRAFFDRRNSWAIRISPSFRWRNSSTKNMARRGGIRLTKRKATPSKDLKRPAIFSELEQYAAEHPQPLANHESPHTTHYSVVDAGG